MIVEEQASQLIAYEKTNQAQMKELVKIKENVGLKNEQIARLDNENS